MIRSQTIPIHAAFQDIPTATVSVAIGPIMNPEIQSRSILTKYLTPASLPRLVEQGMTQHRESRSHALGRLRT